MGKHPDVLIVGGGVIGLTIAYTLARRGVRVEVLERGDFGREASWAGAGILPPGDPDHAATPIDRLRSLGTSRFAEFAAELTERTGIDTGYHVCGSVELLSESDADLPDLWATQNIRHAPIDPADLSPNLNPQPGVRGYHIPDTAQVRNPWLMRALVEGCRALGATLTPNAAFVGWGTIRDRVVAAQTMSAERKPAGAFVVAAGAWADMPLQALGVALGVRPVRGQIALFHCGDRPFGPVVTWGKRYVVPRDDGRVLCGSTEEPEAGFRKGTTPDALADLQRFAESLSPELVAERIESSWSGLRPGTADGLPYLGALPGWRNVFVAAGHFRAGVQLSLGTAEVMAALLTGETPPCPAKPFRPGREPAFGARPAFRS